MADSTDITPAMLLAHLQGMERRLRDEFKSAILESEARLSTRVGAVENRLVKVEVRLEKVEVRLGNVESRLGKVERKVDLLSVQIGNIDERTDDLEVVQVPMLKKAVGLTV